MCIIVWIDNVFASHVSSVRLEVSGLLAPSEFALGTRNHHDFHRQQGRNGQDASMNAHLRDGKRHDSASRSRLTRAGQAGSVARKRVCRRPASAALGLAAARARTPFFIASRFWPMEPSTPRWSESQNELEKQPASTSMAMMNRRREPRTGPSSYSHHLLLPSPINATPFVPACPA